jgi:hypothetical protein
MIKIEFTKVYGWEAAIRGMRNPMNSWEKSDSKWDGFGEADGFSVGEDDLSLMKRLVKAGSDHSKFMRMITVTCDIVAPRYWWEQFSTYRVGVVQNSTSTMHRIHAKKFVLDDFSTERMESLSAGRPLADIINFLNYARERFIETKDKRYWYEMIQMLPQSYNQRRTVQVNYAVLRNMYHARKQHKLDEWRDFCKWVETLPYKELIINDD